MARADIQAGRAYVELLLRQGAFEKGLRSAGQQLQGFGKGIAAIGAIVTAAGAGILGPLLVAVHKFAASGAELELMSKRTGVSVAALSELAFAARESGQDIEVLENSLKKMQKTVGGGFRGGAEGFKALHDIGVSIGELRGLSPDRQFERIAEGISNVRDPTLRAASAIAIFGKSGTALLPMMEKGAAGIRALRKEAQEKGLTKSSAAAKLGLALENSFHRLSALKGKIFGNLGGAMAPAVLEATRPIEAILVSVNKWVKENGALVRSVALVGVGLLVTGTAVTGIGLSIVLLGTALKGIASGFGLLTAGARLALSPFRLLSGVLTGIVGVGSRLILSLVSTGAALVTGVARGAMTAVGWLGSLTASMGRATLTLVAGAARIGLSFITSVAGGVYQATIALARFVPMLARVPGQVAAAFNAARGPVVAFARGAARELQYFITRPAAYAQALAPRLAAAIGSAYGKAANAATAAAGRVTQAWDRASAAVSAKVNQAATAVVTRWNTAAAAIAARVSRIWDRVGPGARMAFFEAAMAVGVVKDQIVGAFQKIAGAVRGPLSRVAVLVRQDFGRIVGIAASVGQGVVAAWRAVGPRIASGLTTATRAAFAGILRAGRATGIGVGRAIAAGVGGVGRGIGGALGGVGALASLAGPALGSFGAMLTIVPNVLSSLGAIGSGLLSLLSPFALLAAAVVGGAALWFRYSGSGKAAFANILAFLGPFVQTFKTTFGGIRDAVAAGDLALAGQIAMAGLKLTLLQGTAALSSAVGGAFGEFLGKLSSQLAGGDFSGAWNTAVTGMAAVWDGFSEGIVAVFSEVVRKVIALWQSGVNFLTNSILSLAKKYPKIGKLLLGVDVKAEDDKAKQQRLADIDVTQRMLASAKDDMKNAQANGGTIAGPNGEVFTTKDIQQQIDELEKHLADLNATPADFVGNAQRDARALTANTANNVRGQLDALDAAAQERARKSAAAAKQASAGGNDDLKNAIDKAQADLDAARERAAKAAAAAKQKEGEDKEKADNLGGDIPDMGSLSREVVGSYSAAALSAGGVGFSKIAEEIKSLRRQHEREAAKEEKRHEKLVGAVKAGGVLG